MGPSALTASSSPINNCYKCKKDCTTEELTCHITQGCPDNDTQVKIKAMLHSKGVKTATGLAAIREAAEQTIEGAKAYEDKLTALKANALQEVMKRYKYESTPDPEQFYYDPAQIRATDPIIQAYGGPGSSSNIPNNYPYPMGGGGPIRISEIPRPEPPPLAEIIIMPGQIYTMEGYGTFRNQRKVPMKIILKEVDAPVPF
jgi:hypothetical protein